jgi:hypothetical protein
LHRKLDGALAMVEEAFSSTTMAELCENPSHRTALCTEETYVAITSR